MAKARRKGKVIVYPTHEQGARQYRWRVVASNGNIIAEGGEAFHRKGAAVKSAERTLEVLQQAADEGVATMAVEYVEDSNGENSKG